MNSQNDDYLKHSPHWIYADLCSWNTGRGLNENKEFENCKIQYTLFTLSTLSNIYPILLQSGYFSHEPGDSIYSFLSHTVTIFQWIRHQYQLL